LKPAILIRAFIVARLPRSPFATMSGDNYAGIHLPETGPNAGAHRYST
jgi:hypothetical protein